MYLRYDFKNDKLYAKIVKSTRVGKKIHKDYINLGLTLDKEQGIYKNRKLGVFKYDVETNIYVFNPEWDTEEYALRFSNDKVLAAHRLGENKAALDKAFTQVLHNAESLAVILKGVVPEYRGYGREEVIGLIDNDLVSDSAFSVRKPDLPGGDIRVRVYYDQKTEKDKRSGYGLARRFSSQLSLALDDVDRNGIGKCYSIYLCRDDVPAERGYSVSMYGIANVMDTGEAISSGDGDGLLTMALVRLGGREYVKSDRDEMFGFLDSVMHPYDEDFIENMKRYIDFYRYPELWKETVEMNGLGQSVYNDGFKDGSVETRERLNKLTGILIESGRIEDLKRSVNDSDYQEELLRELGLEKE